jgi:hypothetical protein
MKVYSGKRVFDRESLAYGEASVVGSRQAGRGSGTCGRRRC